ncbi:GNAT family N-acetyltransferase [Lysobacter sp. N42]|uniref:GNAT family N-acetyltransferase n=1 Tax=Lysobacter sp. N42 TaxID=2545719 RepID=UPI0010515F8E|nr:GNAT family N-acetyltransferase [Lysobacter sp. N42]TCZ88346.1 N-acetyltransferase [Lysobacter sp. N42]
MSLRTRWLASLAEVEATAWDALAGDANPFVRHAFLAGLEISGSLQPHLGWTPRHLTLWRGDTLAAAAPCYVKTNSHGEFVFDHAWAHAYARYGLDYFPKLLCAVPYSPVTGPRLLAPDDASRRALADALGGACAHEGFSSAHVNFLPEAEASAFPDPWIERTDVQYHWTNDRGWRTFDEFLAAMDHRHRKNIRQERAKVGRAGIRFRIVHGSDASGADLDAMYGFYLRTFAEYGNRPALTRAFLDHLAATMPASLVLVLAERAGRPVAGALCLRGGDTLYGRYWGASEMHPGLHFETCYYQGIDFCLHEGLRRFEPGAQGEHKLARGFLPAHVRSRHFVADPAFRAALAGWCADERTAVDAYVARLATHSPFKSGTQ